MLSQEIRRNFLKYFKDKQHAIVPSSSVVPHDDPTLLFINAGMNQFKDVFLGKSHRDYTRAASSQKCIRVGGKHNDLDNVGHTSRHLTFFEMLGNFSFGDYFKKEAIAFSWEVSTEVFRFDPEKIWITIFQEDDEAFELWKKIVPEKKIVRMGEKDNFWAMGDTGPCGPCSELYFDKGDKFGSATSPKEDEAGTRFLEFWNLVFMQFNRDQAGAFQPLPKQSIDTGAGLERVVSLCLGVESVFATDVLRALIAQIEQVSGKPYHADHPSAPAFHVIADHIRALSFAIADGAQPSNVERGYILRKLIRRAVRYGRTLGLQDPFLAKILPKLVGEMGTDYRELSNAQNRIAEVLTLEEESFIRTLKRGGNILNTIIEKAQTSSLKQITGEDAFKLKDTYGFPLEEVLLIAKDTGLQVNLESYQQLEEQARERSRSAHVVEGQQVQQNVYKDFVTQHGSTEFVGYTCEEAEAKVSAIVVNGAFVSALQEGQEATIILNQTPFYAEKGGQVGDSGRLTHATATFHVTDCQSPYSGLTAHVGRLSQGALKVGDVILAKIDHERRCRIANNHTATHLLHWALQRVFGSHIHQAGSLVEPNRLRFDFNHHKAPTKEELRHLEELVNEKIRNNTPVNTFEIPYDEAQTHQEIKQFFGEKYGSKVRVVDIDYSKELCGGTHVQATGTIGLFRIAKEGSVAAGVRRIEAFTGKMAEHFMYELEDISQHAADLFKISPSKLVERTTALVEENKQLTQQLKQFKRAGLKQLAKDLLQQTQTIGSIRLITGTVTIDAELVRELVDDLASQLPSGVILIGVKEEGKCQLIARVSQDLAQRGIQAVQLVKEIATCIQGSGGGKDTQAQAGGKHPEGLTQAFEQAKQWLATKK